jgi:response regulator RpfG family c-di-GMP phosphodiesterase
MLEFQEMMRLGSLPGGPTDPEALSEDPEDAPGSLDSLGSGASLGSGEAPPLVLIVDDDRGVREVLSAVLREEGYRVRLADSAEAALEALRGDGELPLVLCDVKMPGHDGPWLLDRIIERHPTAAVVMLTGYGDTESAVDCLKRGAADYLLKPPRVTELVRAVERAHSRRKLALARRRYHQGLARRVREKTEELSAALQGMPDSILLKPGPLTAAEWAEMRRHPEVGHNILKAIAFLAVPAEIVLTHQERWDGQGYPRKLKGEQIPLGARIFMLADTLDAMTSDRPYRKAATFAQAREEIARCAGTQFDPRCVEAFLAVPEEQLVLLRQG